MTEFEKACDEYFEERSAIMHHCGGLPKEKAEALARAEVDSWRKSREIAAKDAGVQK